MFLKSRLTFLALVGAFFILPVAAHATALPFYGPIVPPANALCPGGWGGLVQLMNNMVAFLVTIAITVVAPLSIAYAGFLFTVNAFNPSGLGKAKTLLLDTIVGIVIILSAWLLVNLFLTAFTAQGLSGWSASLFNNSGSACLQIPTPTASNGLGGGLTANTGVYNTYCQDKNKNCQCSDDNTACSVAALQAAGYTEAQANVMSCIAVTESSGNPNTRPSSSGACGTFQLVSGNWASTQQKIPGCGDAACSNAACNMQGAYLLSQGRMSKGQSPYADWTCAGCNSKAQGCVNAYANTAPAVSGPTDAINSNNAY